MKQSCLQNAKVYKNPPSPPFAKGGKSPLCKRGVRGDFQVKYLSVLLQMAFLVLPSLAVAEDKTVNPAKIWDSHYGLYFLLMVIVWLVVTIPLIYFSFRYRRKKGEKGDGAYNEGNILLELTWTIIPMIIILLLGVQTWAVFKDYRAVPKDAYEVKVEGFMWGWEITYPDGTKTTNELRVPEGVPIKVNLTARDVLHAFYIPEYRVQEEAIPGRTTYFWFNPVKTGQYRAYCTEFCGTGHSVMLAKVIVMGKEDFQAWIGQQKGIATAMPTAERGAKLVEDLGCTMCHSITGEEGGGPTFKGIFGRKTLLADNKTIIVDDSYIKTSILSPKDKLVKGFDPVMQAYKLPDNDIKAITEYLKTLK